MKALFQLTYPQVDVAAVTNELNLQSEFKAAKKKKKCTNRFYCNQLFFRYAHSCHQITNAIQKQKLQFATSTMLLHSGAVSTAKTLHWRTERVWMGG